MIKIVTAGGRELYTAESAQDVRTALIEAVRAGADLGGADLGGAYLGGAYLGGAYLRGADLRGADLGGAYLRGADLRGADLGGAYLAGAYLAGADLRGAYLRGAYLGGAYLGGAYLGGADLGGAYLRGAVNADVALAQISILPEGDLIGYKKANGSRIVKLLIPAHAKRSNASGRKCRAAEAVVLTITDAAGAEVDEAFSNHDPGFRYTPGATVTPTTAFDEDPLNECAAGIHFFITRPEAEAWV